MLCAKAVCNGLRLESKTPFDFQLRTQSVPLFFFILKDQVLVDKQMCFEIHHYL